MEAKINLTKAKKIEKTPLKGWRLATVLFFVGGLSTTLLFYSGDIVKEWKGFLLAFTHQGLIWVILWMGNGFFSELVGRKISWTEQPVLRFILTVLVTIVYTVGSMFVFFMLWSWAVWKNSFEKSLQWIDISTFYVGLIITAIIALFLHGRGFLLSWRTAAVEAEQLKRANIASQFEALKSQVNPHFLFNSLNVLSTLVYKDQDLAASFIKQLSNVYRYVLDMKDKEVVSLEEEIKALEAYLFLAKIRHGDNLKAEITIPERSNKIAPLTLQLLVENAIKHNIVSKKKPLAITITQEGDFIVVQNNLQKKVTIEPSSGIGLPNITERYQYLSDQNIEIIESNDFFTVKIPLLKL